MAVDQDALQNGTRLSDGSIVLHDVLTRDTASITYLATDASDRAVLVQECFPKDLCHREGASLIAKSNSAGDSLKRLQKKFTSTAEKLSRIADPSLPTVLAQFTENDIAYVVLSRPNGDTLATILQDQRNRLRMREISGLMNTALTTLHLLHGQGILHGNISAGSLLLDADNNLQFTQFNFLLPDAAAADQIAAALDDDPYVAPEYVAATGLGGARSDLYSLGAAFYQAILRKAPPSALARVTALLGGQADPITPVRKVAIAYRPAFRQGIDRALCISEADRPASAADWLALIKADGPYEPRPGEEFDEADTPEPIAPVRAAAASIAPVEVAPVPPPQVHQVAEVAPLVPTPEPALAKPKLKVGMIIGAGAVAAAVGAYVLFSVGSDQPEPTEIARVEPTATQTEVAPTVVVPATEPTPVAKIGTASTAVVVPAPPPEPAAEAPAIEPTVAAPQPDEVVIPADKLVLEETVATEPTVEVATIAPEPVSPAASIEPQVTVSDKPDAAPETFLLADPAPVSPVEIAVAEAVAEPAVPAPELPPKPIQPVIMDVSAVMSVFSVVLPFTPATESPDIIGALGEGAEPWAAVGLKVISVNGIDVAQIVDISPALRQSGDLAKTSVVDLDLEIMDVASGEVKTVTAALPVVRDIALLNGLRFQERDVDGGVQTIVTMVALAQAEGGDPELLRIGDIVKGYLATNEKIGVDIDLTSLMTREITKGTAQFAFAVERAGEKVNTSFEYTPNGN